MRFFEILYYLAVRGLRCCASFSLVVVQRPHIAVASLGVEHRLWGAQASVAAHMG